MQLYKLSAVICALCSVQLLLVDAYPTLALPFWSSGSSLTVDKRHKKTGTFVAQSDADVLELENLRQPQQQQQQQHNANDNLDHVEPEQQQAQALPELERRLELAESESAAAEAAAVAAEAAAEAPAAEAATPAAAAAAVPTIETSEKSDGLESEIHGIHRPPTLPAHDGGKIGQQHADEVAAAANLAPPLAPTITKPFYGAARLAFGQNPEVLPTTTTTTTSTTTTTTTTTAMPTTTTTTTTVMPPTVGAGASGAVVLLPETFRKTAADLIVATPMDPHVGTIDEMSAVGGGAAPGDDVEQQQQQQQQGAEGVAAAGKEQLRVDQIAGAVGDVVEVETTKAMPSRRSSMSNRLTASPKTMAQYVFWTGDEVGVARAVEEFIEQGLMTRESALKFLRDIRLSIENLQRSYQSKMLSDEAAQQNMIKKNHHQSVVVLPPTTTSTTTTTTTTTERAPVMEATKPIDNEPEWQRTANRLLAPNRISLPEYNNEVGQEEMNLHGYNSANGRVKISELLYAEYTLEEILYKLAKAMFTQSLSHGSDETQKELQKLTNFLEREGDLGVIPIDLQKKILNVLLTALSDTLREHPELLTAANVNLATPYNRQQHHNAAAYEAIN